MERCLIWVLAIALTSFVSAQNTNYLVLIKRTTQKEITFEEGTFVVVKSFNGTKVRGRLQVKTDKLIQVKNQVIPLTNVKYIGNKDGFISKTASLILSNGMNLVLFGLNENLRQGFDTPSNFYKAGIPMLSLGFPLYFISRKYRVKRYTYLGVLNPW
jgi:hypothetical protein